MAENLQPVYVNNERIRLEGDPKPNVAKVIECCGKQAARVEVFRLANRQDQYGQKLTVEDIIDRTIEADPVFLKLLEKESAKEAPPTGPSAGRESPMRTAGMAPPQGAPPAGPQPPQPGATPTPAGTPEKEEMGGKPRTKRTDGTGSPETKS